jgi:hypothetical protein
MREKTETILSACDIHVVQNGEKVLQIVLTA